MRWKEIVNEEVLYMRKDLKDFTLKNPSLKELRDLTFTAYDEFENKSNIKLNNNEYGCVRGLMTSGGDYYFAPSTYRIHGEVKDSLNIDNDDVMYFSIQIPRNEKRFTWYERRGMKITPYLTKLGLK